MKFPVRLLVLAVGCCAVAVEFLSGNNGLTTATSVLTVAGVIAT